MSLLVLCTAFGNIASMIAQRFNGSNNPSNSRPQWSRGSEVLLS